MNIADLWAQIESDQSWRQGEIRFFQNQLSAIADDQQKDQFRRALILILYAHFEGFCKFALTLYVDTVNRLGITCGQANYAIAAASLTDLFTSLRNPDKKCDEFRRDLPDDKALHRFARDKEFIELTHEIEGQVVNIPDYVVDTESNLKPVVLRKNLFRLGFNHDHLVSVEGKIHALLNYRNGIAHGDMKAGISHQTYEELRDTTYSIMNQIKIEVMAALRDKRYLRSI